MKRIVLLFLIVSLLFITCNTKPKETVTDAGKDDTDHVTVAPNQGQNAEQDMQKVKEDLGKVNPLSGEELKALMPEQLMGTPATTLEVNGAMGANVVSADYKINDSTTIKLEVVDCAGPGGIGLFEMQYLNIADNEKGTDEESTFKKIDYNGYKAFESCRKNRPGDCTFTYFSGNRFLISLQGNNTGIDELKRVAKELLIIK